MRHIPFQQGVGCLCRAVRKENNALRGDASLLEDLPKDLNYSGSYTSLMMMGGVHRASRQDGMGPVIQKGSFGKSPPNIDPDPVG
jgi:hypothetical protein